MSHTSTTNRDSPILQHLRATKKFLQDVTTDARYIWSGEMGRIGGLRLEFAGP
jgi:hypothetical protein